MNGRVYTTEEIRDHFLAHIYACIDYWEKESRTQAIREKLEGLAFTLLVAIDGETMDLPMFLLAPMAHPEDKQFHCAHGENYYPENNGNAIEGNIAGSLHDRFSAMKWEGK